jgi:hypothetical protein
MNFLIVFPRSVPEDLVEIPEAWHSEIMRVNHNRRKIIRTTVEPPPVR